MRTTNDKTETVVRALRDIQGVLGCGGPGKRDAVAIGRALAHVYAVGMCGAAGDVQAGDVTLDAKTEISLALAGVARAIILEFGLPDFMPEGTER